MTTSRILPFFAPLLAACTGVVTPSPAPTPVESGSAARAGAAAPVEPRSPAEYALSVAMGAGHTCALYRDGHLGCWGHDGYGEAEPPPGHFTALAASNSGACALDETRHAQCWGIANTSDIAGVGEDPLKGPPDELAALAAGGENVCGLRPDGGVVCWGKRHAYADTKVLSRSREKPFASIAASAFDLCGVARDGELVCQSAVAGKTTAPPSGEFVAVSVGDGSACATDRAGAIHCWGACEEDVCGAPAGAFAQVAVGSGLGCALREDGTAACWGKYAAERGLPPDARLRSLVVRGAWACGVTVDGAVLCPTDVLSALGPVDTLVAGSGIMCAIERRDGALRCFDSSGVDERERPPRGAFKGVAPGIAGGGCALRTDGEVACWQPRPGHGKLGLVAPPAPGPFERIATNGFVYCGLRAAGSIACWGELPGDVGPIAVPDGKFTNIAMAGVYLFAERQDGEVVASRDTCCVEAVAVRPRSICGGIFQQCVVDASGGLSCGNVTPASFWGSMRKMDGGYLEASCNDSVTCVLREDRAAQCFSGAPMTDAQAARWLPPPGPFTHVATTVDFACAVRQSGKLACWGNLAFGRAPNPSP